MDISSYLNSLKTFYINKINPGETYIKEFIKNKKQYDVFEFDYEYIYTFEKNDNNILLKLDKIRCHFVKNIRCNYDFRIIRAEKDNIFLEILDYDEKKDKYCIIRYTGILLSDKLYEMFMYNLCEYMNNVRIIDKTFKLV